MILESWSTLLVTPLAFLALCIPIYIRLCSENKILLYLVRIAAYMCIILGIFVSLVSIDALFEGGAEGIIFSILGLGVFLLGMKMAIDTEPARNS